MNKIYKNPVPKRRDYFCSRHAIRMMKDTLLHDDIQDFISKHDIGLNNLVTKLLNEHFPRQRHSDPEYPGYMGEQ